MTKLEFLDRINDVLIGLNTAESDAIGSLYDELMHDAGWHPASELPNMGEEVVTWVNHEDGVITVARGIYVGWPEEIINKLRWCYPPKFD